MEMNIELYVWFTNVLKKTYFWNQMDSVCVTNQECIKQQRKGTPVKSKKVYKDQFVYVWLNEFDKVIKNVTKNFFFPY